MRGLTAAGGGEAGNGGGLEESCGRAVMVAEGVEVQYGQFLCKLLFPSNFHRRKLCMLESSLSIISYRAQRTYDGRVKPVISARYLQGRKRSVATTVNSGLLKAALDTKNDMALLN